MKTKKSKIALYLMAMISLWSSLWANFRGTTFYRKYVYPVRLRYWRFKEGFYDCFLKNASKLPGRKVYAVRFSRDCDMYERYDAVMFKNHFAYRYAIWHLYEGAEGPRSLTEITKEEYDEYQPTHRDRVMEAYENGNGSSIYV